MVKDENYLQLFKYLNKSHYRAVWELKDYSQYKKTQAKRIKNFWDTFKYYGFDEKILSNK